MGSSVCLDHLANIYHRLGNASMSVSFLERALTVKRLRHDDKGCASTLLRLGEERLALGQSRAALESLTLALSGFEALSDTDSTAACLERLGDAYVRLGLPRDAITMYRKALPIRVEAWDKVGEAKCYDALGLAHYSLGELLEAAACFEKACAIWKAEEDPVSLIESLEALGGVFFQAGRHSDAIDAYTRHLQLVRDRDEGHADAEVLVRLGLSYASVGQFERALRALSGALNAFGASNDNSGRATCLQHIGSVRGRMGQIDSGIAALDTSLKLRRDMRDWQGESDCLQELGIVHHLAGAHSIALQHLRGALAIVEKSNDKASTSTINMHIGKIYRATQKPVDAVQALKLARDAGLEAENAGIWSFFGGWAAKAECLHEYALALSDVRDPSCVELFKDVADEWVRLGDNHKSLLAMIECARSAFKLPASNRASHLHVVSFQLQRCLNMCRASRNEKSREIEAECLYLSGLSNEFLGNCRAAAPLFKEASNMYEVLGDAHGQARSLLHFGTACLSLQKRSNLLSEAVEALTRSLQLRQELQDVEGSFDCSIAIVRAVLFNVSAPFTIMPPATTSAQDDYFKASVAKAIPALKDSIASVSTAEQASLRASAICQSMCVLSHAHCIIGSVAAGFQFAQDALQSATRQGDLQLQGAAELEMARCLLYAGKDDDALVHANKSRELYSLCGDKKAQASSCIACAEIQSSRRCHIVAVADCDAAIACCNGAQDEPLLRTALLLQRRCNISLGNNFGLLRTQEQLNELGYQVGMGEMVDLLEPMFHDGADLSQFLIANPLSVSSKLADAASYYGNAASAQSIISMPQPAEPKQSAEPSDAVVALVSKKSRCLLHASRFLFALDGDWAKTLKEAENCLVALAPAAQNAQDAVTFLISRRFTDAAIDLIRVSISQGRCMQESHTKTMMLYVALDLAKSVGDESILVEAKDALALQLLKTGSFNDALGIIDGVAELQRSQSHVTQSLLSQFSSHGQLTDQFHQLQIQIREATARGDRVTQASLLTSLAHACTGLHMFQPAAGHMRAACALYEQLGDPSAVLTCSLKLARLLADQGALHDSIQHLKAVVLHSNDLIQRADVIGRACPFKIIDLCEAYALMCTCESQAGLIEDALSSGKTGLVIAIEHADVAAESTILSSLASVYLQIGVLPVALEHSARALVCASQSVATSTFSVRALLLNSRICWALGDSDACVRHLNDARDLVRIGSLGPDEPLVLCEYAKILKKRGQPLEALDYLRRAAAAAKHSATPNPRLTCTVAIQTAKLHAASGNSNSSYAQYVHVFSCSLTRLQASRFWPSTS
jgi:tetratricopeptide (TPR) repeat protein